MEVDMKAFLRTGEFGSLIFGINRRQLEIEIGIPDAWGEETAKNTAQIWLYGSLEFYFPKQGDGLYMIFSDHLDPLEGNQSLSLNAWIISHQLGLQTAETTLKHEEIAYKRIDNPQLGTIDLMLSSGVVLRFDPKEKTEGYVLSGFWYKNTQPI